ncbi:MAG: NAD(P)H-dependent glycerol-3-phosphate dehydrogenase [Candidatus Limnocylindrales bacterium]
MDRHATRAVIGAGQWGTTLALQLARRGPVTLLARDEEQARLLIGERRNSRYLPDIALPVEIEISADPSALSAARDLVIFAVPSKAMRSTAERVKGALHEDAVLLSVAKGLEQGSLDRMTQVLADVLPQAQGRIGAMSGPNLALEIARGLPASAVIAAEDEDVSLRASEMIGTRSFRVYRNRDVIGVELCGALKNVIAIAAGAAEQLGFGDNGKAGLITRGLAEMTRLGMAVGAHPLTFAGLAGLGDVIATCYSALSRNHALGVELAKGRKWPEIEGTLAGVAEGAYTVEAALALAGEHGVEMPIAQEVHNGIYEGKSVQRCLIDLLSREQKDELADVEQWARRSYGDRSRTGV